MDPHGHCCVTIPTIHLLFVETDARTSTVGCHSLVRCESHCGGVESEHPVGARTQSPLLRRLVTQGGHGASRGARASKQAGALTSKRVNEQAGRRVSAAGRLRVRGHVRLALAALGRVAEAHGPSAGYRGARSGSGVGGRGGRSLPRSSRFWLELHPGKGRGHQCKPGEPGVELQGPCSYHNHKGAQL